MADLKWLDELDRLPDWTLRPEARNALPRLLEISRAAREALEILETGPAEVEMAAKSVLRNTLEGR